MNLSAVFQSACRAFISAMGNRLEYGRNLHGNSDLLPPPAKVRFF